MLYNKLYNYKRVSNFGRSQTCINKGKQYSSCGNVFSVQTALGAFPAQIENQLQEE